METIWKGKQTNKQAEAACAKAQMQGVVWGCRACGVQYAMCQSMQKSFGDALEKHRVQYTESYSDTGSQTRIHHDICGWGQHHGGWGWRIHHLLGSVMGSMFSSGIAPGTLGTGPSGVDRFQHA